MIFGRKAHAHRLERRLTMKCELPEGVTMAGRKPANDLTGRRQGKIEVLAFAGRKAYGKRQVRQAIWKCRCDCGTEFYVRQDNLMTKINPTRSCGCAMHPTGESNGRFSGFGELYGTYWKHVIRNAKKRGIPFKLTPKQAWLQFQRQKGKCALTGCELTLSRGWPGRRGNASLDRIDSSKGYAPENIQWVLTKVNCMKSNLPDDEFIRVCRLVAAHADKGKALCG